MENKKRQIDPRQLTAEQQAQLQRHEQSLNSVKQLQAIKDNSAVLQEFLNTLDKQADLTEKSSKDMGTLLVDIRESLAAIKSKKDPEQPDFAEPVVSALEKLEKALKAIEVKPEVKVDGAKVDVQPPDLKPIEKILKTDLPKAFDKAIKAIPKVNIPKTDNKPLLKAWEGISEQLESIEHATRMKPLPGSMTVSNLADITTQTDALTDTELRATPIPTSITSQVPGTGATNLGKARGSAVGATDTGVAMLAEVQEGETATEVDEGDYGVPSLTSWRELRTRDQRAVDLANCNDYTVFTTLGNDTDNLADETDHVFGTGAITFDKVDGAANTVYAGVQDTFTAIDISERFESGAFVGLGVKLTSVADVSKVFVRVGTDSSNYNYWEWSADSLSTGTWLALRAPTNQPVGSVGNGWNTASLTYVAFGVEFNAETDTLAGIKFDNVHMVGGRVTDTSIDASISSDINSPNINLHKVGNKVTDTNTGNASAGTQRVVLASDQPDVDIAIKSSDLDLMLGTDFSAVFGVNTLLTTTQADSRVNTTDGFTVNAWGQVFNGSTWDRMRGDTTGTYVKDQRALTPYFDSDGDNTAQTMKASAGHLYTLEVSNPNDVDIFIQLFDSSSVTVGTTTPKQSFLVPANGAMDKAFVVPINFANSIKYACTTTATGSTDPTTGAVINGGYI